MTFLEKYVLWVTVIFMTIHLSTDGVRHEKLKKEIQMIKKDNK